MARGSRFGWAGIGSREPVFAGPTGSPAEAGRGRVPPTSQNRRHERPSGSAHAQIPSGITGPVKGITLAGTMLILGLTVLAFAGGRLFGRVEEPTTGAQVETTAQTVPAPEVAPVAPELEPVVETPIALPAAFVRAPIVCLDPGHGGEDRGFARFSRAASRPWKRRCSCSSTHGTSRRAWNNVGMK